MGADEATPALPDVLQITKGELADVMTAIDKKYTIDKKFKKAFKKRRKGLWRAGEAPVIGAVDAEVDASSSEESDDD